MPTYSYRCSGCGFEFERVQRMSEDAIKECPSCKKLEAKRPITLGELSFFYAGGGWYSDLYSGGSNKKAAASGRQLGKSRREPPTATAKSGRRQADGVDSAATSTAPAATSYVELPPAPAPSYRLQRRPLQSALSAVAWQRSRINRGVVPARCLEEARTVAAATSCADATGFARSMRPGAAAVGASDGAAPAARPVRAGLLGRSVAPPACT